MPLNPPFHGHQLHDWAGTGQGVQHSSTEGLRPTVLLWYLLRAKSVYRIYLWPVMVTARGSTEPRTSSSAVGMNFHPAARPPHRHLRGHLSGERCALEFSPRWGFPRRWRESRSGAAEGLVVHLPDGCGARPPSPTPRPVEMRRGQKAPADLPPWQRTAAPIPPCHPRTCVSLPTQTTRQTQRQAGGTRELRGTKPTRARLQPPVPWGGSAPSRGYGDWRAARARRAPGVAGNPPGVAGSRRGAMRSGAGLSPARRSAGGPGRARKDRRRKSSPITPSAVRRHHGRGSPHRRRLSPFLGGGKRPPPKPPTTQVIHPACKMQPPGLIFPAKALKKSPCQGRGGTTVSNICSFQVTPEVIRPLGKGSFGFRHTCCCCSGRSLRAVVPPWVGDGRQICW